MNLVTKRDSNYVESLLIKIRNGSMEEVDCLRGVASKHIKQKEK
jgi:hypothetical protein